jgi:hypothetical protein
LNPWGDIQLLNTVRTGADLYGWTLYLRAIVGGYGAARPNTQIQIGREVNPRPYISAGMLF